MDLEQQLNKVLSDPESMKTIMQLAQSLTASTNTEPPPQSVPPDLGQAGQLFQLMQTVQQVGQQDPQQKALLDALRPFVSGQHCHRLERAMQMAKLSQLAGLALQGYEQT